MKNDEIIFEDWGLISYEEAWKLQELRLQEIVEIKMENRKSGGQKLRLIILFSVSILMYIL